MTHILKRYLPLALGSLLMLGMLAGCKSPGASGIVQPTATKTTIEIRLQRTTIGVNDPLGILIKNIGSQDLYALNGQAYCTILQLQQYDPKKKDWVVIDRCRDSTPPHALVIHAGMSEPFTLPPGSSADPNAWATGDYRIAIRFSPHPDGVTDAQITYSQGFTITSS